MLQRKTVYTSYTRVGKEGHLGECFTEPPGERKMVATTVFRPDDTGLCQGFIKQQELNCLLNRNNLILAAQSQRLSHQLLPQSRDVFTLAHHDWGSNGYVPLAPLPRTGSKGSQTPSQEGSIIRMHITASPKTHRTSTVSQ